MRDGPRIAPDGQVWVCAACGKTSKDRYGDDKSSWGWDESCMLNSVLCYADKRFNETGVLSWMAVPFNERETSNG
jgi:hypothetical protein